MSIRVFWMLATIGVVVTACATAPTPPPTAASTPTPGSMTASTPGAHMIHQAQHGGQLGMSETLHIEIVSKRPGEYAVYLSEPSGKPIALDGATLEVALIDAAGNELFNLPASVDGSREYFVAKGGPTDLTQADVRVKVQLSENTELVEMDFTLTYAP